MTRKAKPSTSIHTSRAKARTSHTAKSNSMSLKSLNFSRNTIITVIVLAMIVVVLALLSKTFVNDEIIVKHTIENIASDYYENYYYDSIVHADSLDGADKSLIEVFDKYHERGFAIQSLRQLLLFDNQRHAESADYLTKYCDENATTIQIFPDAPYGKNNYHVKYNYSCEF